MLCDGRVGKALLTLSGAVSGLKTAGFWARSRDAAYNPPWVLDQVFEMVEAQGGFLVSHGDQVGDSGPRYTMLGSIKECLLTPRNPIEERLRREAFERGRYLGRERPGRFIVDQRSSREESSGEQRMHGESKSQVMETVLRSKVQPKASEP